MHAVRPLDSPNDLSKGHITGVVGPEASTSEENDFLHLNDSEKNMSYANREAMEQQILYITLELVRIVARLCTVKFDYSSVNSLAISTVLLLLFLMI